MAENPEFSIFTLSNGLRVVHKHVHSAVAHCGLMINAGTRDELNNEYGLAHFIEHAIFKGTKKRRSYHILNRLDSVGGEIDAYTTKENTCFYASFLTEYYDRAIELISDITLNSTFPEKEMLKEKEVVLDEINVYQDSPSDQIYDDFEAQVFSNHELGNPILGTAESIRELKASNIRSFMSRLYQSENMVFTSVGNITEKRLKVKLEKHFSGLKKDSLQQKRNPFKTNNPQTKHQKKNTNQTHCIMGKAVMGADDPKRTEFILLNNVLGGPAMNSILNLKVREKYGFTYNIESNYSMYSDCGLFSIYLASDPKYMDRCVKATIKELRQLSRQKLSVNKLHLAKQQLKGQLAISRESNNGLMLTYAKSLLQHNRINNLKEIYERVDSINAKDILEMANKHLNPESFDFLYYDGN